MSDPASRLALAGVIVASGLVLIAGINWRRRRGATRTPLDLGGFSGRVLFFTDATCRNCAAARRVLEASGREFDEIAYDHEPALVRAVGVIGVPLIVVRNESLDEVGRIAGTVSPRRLQRMLRRAGI